jgi:hypothetical protein
VTSQDPAAYKSNDTRWKTIAGAGGIGLSTRKSLSEQTQHVKETPDFIGFMHLRTLAIPA